MILQSPTVALNRFCLQGEQRLPCNCGALACRGYVNVPEEDESVLLPRKQLEALLAAQKGATQQ